MTVRCFFVQYLNAFLCGGVLCAVGQVLLDRTKLTPARILVCYVTAGVLLGGLGLYAPLVEWAGAGATVPLTGFGFTLAKGVQKAVSQHGLLGALTGGISATAGGITAAIFFGFLASNSSSTRGRPCVISSPATPPLWKVLMVSWVPGSPIDCAAIIPTASPTCTASPVAMLAP